MSDYLPVSLPVRSAELAGRREYAFELAPEAGDRATIAALIGAAALRKLTFGGTLRPEGRRDLVLEARLGATVVQPCVVTLAPVTSRIDQTVIRRYVAGLAEPGAAEAEMPEDDSIEPLPEVIDIAAVMVEALALALPDYPRAEGAELGEAVHAAPGTAPLRDADLRPFAGLAALRDGLARPDGEPGDGEGGKGGGR